MSILNQAKKLPVPKRGIRETDDKITADEVEPYDILKKKKKG